MHVSRCGQKSTKDVKNLSVVLMKFLHLDRVLASNFLPLKSICAYVDYGAMAISSVCCCLSWSSDILVVMSFDRLFEFVIL